MAEKKQRRERLSPRDHRRAVTTAQAITMLVDTLEMLYPTDLDLKIAAPAMQRFVDKTVALGFEHLPIAEPAEG